VPFDEMTPLATTARLFLVHEIEDQGELVRAALCPLVAYVDDARAERASVDQLQVDPVV
jgi:hypothetical protein